MTRHIVSLADLLSVVTELFGYLSGRIGFTNDGWPIFNEECFLRDWPEAIIPYPHRNSVVSQSKKYTVLCFFCADKFIYPRFSRILEDLETYRQYLGVISPDITVTWDMDVELQRTIMLANQLFLAVLAVNKIKIVFNTRSGSAESIRCFSHIPRGATWASGFLGCDKASNFYEASIYTDKILKLMPEKLIIYGKKDALINKQLYTTGINYRYYDDFHTKSKKAGGRSGRL